MSRMGLLVRPGQKATLLHGTEETGVLKKGTRLEIEPNLGANDHIIDLRFSVESKGRVQTMLSTGVTLERGIPLVMPLGRAKGISFGAVIEARLPPTLEMTDEGGL